MSTLKADLTSAELAEQAAAAIGTHIVALRMANGPYDSVPADELESYAKMREALAELASCEYDRGFRRAVAMHASRAAPSTPDRDNG